MLTVLQIYDTCTTRSSITVKNMVFTPELFHLFVLDAKESIPLLVSACTKNPCGTVDELLFGMHCNR